MTTMTTHLTALTLCLMAIGAQAAVSATEAAKLKGELTPFGAERAGNKDGSIPAWTGNSPAAGSADPFKDEKPLFSITAQNLSQHAGKLTDGQQAMFKKFPAYRLDVYKTQRSAIAPQWVYDNNILNATRAKLNGSTVSGAFGGIPFPIPKTGEEAVWNHHLRWRGVTMESKVAGYLVNANGSPSLTMAATNSIQMPYYFQDGNVESLSASNEYWMVRLNTDGPAIRAGEALVGRGNMDSDKDQAWVYLSGQRRVRKLPNVCCDTPAPHTAGVMTFDEMETLNGRLTKFDWKIIGKQEVYLPYNTSAIARAKDDAEFAQFPYPNPDYMRWELHRAWVIEATLRPGERHAAVRSRYYCDEDSWQCLLADRWDSKGQLWRVLWSSIEFKSELPGMVTNGMGYTDMLSGAGYVERRSVAPRKQRFPDSMFTPDALAGEGVR